MADGLMLDLEVICDAEHTTKIEDYLSLKYVHVDNPYCTVTT